MDVSKFVIYTNAKRIRHWLDICEIISHQIDMGQPQASPSLLGGLDISNAGNLVHFPVGVQLRRVAGWRKPPNTVVVTRATKWGNPFVIGRPSSYGFVQDAATAVDFYRRWIHEDETGQATLKLARQVLAGRNLACFCPLGGPCHRSVLLELANAPETTHPTP